MKKKSKRVTNIVRNPNRTINVNRSVMKMMNAVIAKTIQKVDPEEFWSDPCWSEPLEKST